MSEYRQDRARAVTVRLFVKNLTDERAYLGGGAIVNGLNIPVRVDANVLQRRGPRRYFRPVADPIRGGAEFERLFDACLMESN